MTLVYRAKKPQIHAHSNLLGPGQYLSMKQNLTKTHLKNTSSFASLSRRNDNNGAGKCPGPGSYNINNQYLSQSKTSNCKAVFQSKISRIDDKQTRKNDKQHNLECQKGLSNSSAFWKQQLDKNKVTGKVYKGQRYHHVLKDSKMAKSIPSIPTWQQSYGYRVDQKSHQLIQNKNPNVLIAHQSNILTNKEWQNKGPGYYFVRDEKRQMAHKWSKSNAQRSQIQLKHCLQFPAPNHYSVKSQSKKYLFKSTNLPKDGRFTQQTPKNYKQLLLLKKISKQFADYLDEQIEQSKQLKHIKEELKACDKNLIRRLENENYKVKPYNLETLQQRYNKCKKQCFQSRAPRFNQATKEKSTQLSKIQNEPTLSPMNKKFQSLNSSTELDSIKAQNQLHQLQSKKKHSSINLGKQIPFGAHGDRFKGDRKSNLGPGHYYKQNNQSVQIKKGALISFNQSRFYVDKQSQKKPGPGSYNVQKQYNFRNRNNEIKCSYSVKNLLKQQKDISQQSIQKLYSSYGRQVNFYLKQSNISKLQQRTHEQISNKRDNETIKQAAFLSTVQRDCMVTIQKEKITEIPSITAQKKFRKKNIMKHIKKQYKFIAPQKSEFVPGPGDYQIKGKVQKKTFNVTYSQGKSDLEMLFS